MSAKGVHRVEGPPSLRDVRKQDGLLSCLCNYSAVSGATVGLSIFVRFLTIDEPILAKRGAQAFSIGSPNVFFMPPSLTDDA